MTRFNITLSEGVDMVLLALRESLGGELFVPKMPSYRISDLANAIDPSCKQVITGIRPGEKIHEDMITKSDSKYTYDFGNYFVVFPTSKEYIQRYIDAGRKFKNVEPNFSYNSETNSKFLTIEEIKSLISKNLN